MQNSVKCGGVNKKRPVFANLKPPPQAKIKIFEASVHKNSETHSSAIHLSRVDLLSPLLTSTTDSSPCSDRGVFSTLLEIREALINPIQISNNCEVASSRSRIMASLFRVVNFKFQLEIVTGDFCLLPLKLNRQRYGKVSREVSF